MKLNFFSPPFPKRHRYFIWDFWIKKQCSYYSSFPRLLFGHCNKFRRGKFLHKNAISFSGLSLTIKTDDFIGKIDQQLLLITLLQNSLSILVRGNYEKLVWLQRTQFSSFCTKRYHIFGYKIETFYW